MLSAVVGLVLAAGSPAHGSQLPPIVVHIGHDSRNGEAAELAQALREVCRLSRVCRVESHGKGSTILHVSAARSRDTLHGTVYIFSRVISPGSIGLRDQSVDRLAGRLLEAVRERQRTDAAIVEMPSSGMAR